MLNCLIDICKHISGSNLNFLSFSTLEPADMQWPVIKNFVEQWKALMEKKKVDIGTPPNVYKWLEQMGQYLATYIGIRKAPFTYLTRPDVIPPAVHGPCVADQHYSDEYVSIEQEMQFCVGQGHTLGRSDNEMLFQLIEKSVQGHMVAETIAPFKRTQNGRGALLAIKDQPTQREGSECSLTDGDLEWNYRHHPPPAHCIAA